MLNGIVSSLRARALAIVLAAVLPGFALILVSTAQERHRDVDEAAGEMLVLARTAALHTAGMIEAAHQLLAAIANMPEVRRLDSVHCSSALADLAQRFPQYAYLGAVSIDGTTFCSAPPSKAPARLIDASHFRRALLSTDFAVGNHAVQDGTLAVAVAQPVVDGTGATVGAAVAALAPESFDQWASRASLPQGSTVAVVAGRGAVLARYPADLHQTGRALEPGPLADALLGAQEKDGITESTDASGQPHLYVFTHVGPSDPDLTVVVGRPKAIVMAEANRDLAGDLIVLALFAAVALGGAWLGTERALLRPIDTLLTATQRLGGGDLAARTGLSHDSGEIGRLAAAYDAMAEALDTRERLRSVAEAHLRQQKELLETILERIPVMIAFIGSNAQGKWVNKAFQETLGWSMEEALADDFLSKMYPDPDDRAEVVRYVLDPPPGWRDFQTCAKDGRVVETSWANVVLSDGGRIGIGQDITDRKVAEGALVQRGRQQAAVARLGQQALRVLDVQAILDVAAEAVADTLDAEYSEVLEVLPDSEQMLLRAGVGWPSGYVGSVKVPVGSGSHVGYALCSERAVVVEDFGRETRFEAAAHLRDHGALSGMAVGIGGPELPFGVLAVHARRRRVFSEDDVHFLEAVARVLASTILRARAEDERTSLLRRMISAQDDERRRTARELHDEAGQSLTGVLVGLRLVEQATTLADANAGARRLREIASLAITDIGRLARGLHPSVLDDMGLVAVVRRYAREYARLHGVAVSVNASDHLRRLPGDCELTLYRVVQEALTNAARHAHATSIEITIEEDGANAELRVRDDGAGFDVNAMLRGGSRHRLGLVGLRERVALLGGSVFIESRPGRGTIVRVRVPVRETSSQ